MDMEIDKKKYADSVSYTHLDVYKRQVLRKKKIMDRLLVLTVQNLFLLFLLKHLIRLRMHFLL